MARKTQKQVERAAELLSTDLIPTAWQYATHTALEWALGLDTPATREFSEKLQRIEQNRRKALNHI